MAKPGPTGEFPHGKLGENDEGALNVGIGTDLANGLVVVQFGTPTAWLAMPIAQAEAFARGILEAAARLKAARN